MLKSLGYKAEAFKRYYSTLSRDNLDQVKEVCFDIQVQLLEFFTTAIKSMRGEEDETHRCKSRQTNGHHKIQLT